MIRTDGGNPSLNFIERLFRLAKVIKMVNSVLHQPSVNTGVAEAKEYKMSAKIQLSVTSDSW